MGTLRSIKKETVYEKKDLLDYMIFQFMSFATSVQNYITRRIDYEIISTSASLPRLVEVKSGDRRGYYLNITYTFHLKFSTKPTQIDLTLLSRFPLDTQPEHRTDYTYHLDFTFQNNADPSVGNFAFALQEETMNWIQEWSRKNQETWSEREQTIAPL